MVHTAAPVAGDVTMEPHTSEKPGTTHNTANSANSIIAQQQIRNAPGLENAWSFWEECYSRTRTVVTYGSKGRRLLADL
ncbi:hypothetical protein BFW01_g10344 [Lasiodiplodia theobromae]|uniref:Uncharacterized protein n=1 Tax=Lasiodiplodia theobromae TaxID=45133 RepID=A0A8H7IPA6_9PEZI|nr:hypothetical protein BFW01_g10344 [Lasiodiplodia theobromae]